MSITQTSSGRYQFRKRVPAELVEAYQAFTGTKGIEFKKALGTSDYKQATLLPVNEVTDDHMIE